MRPKTKGPEAVAAAPSPDRNSSQTNPSNSPRKSKQAGRPGTHRYEQGGRYLYRYGAYGVTVFDLWKWTGKPIEKWGRQ